MMILCGGSEDEGSGGITAVNLGVELCGSLKLGGVFCLRYCRRIGPLLIPI
jgi:hypothetical protein